MVIEFVDATEVCIFLVLDDLDYLFLWSALQVNVKLNVLDQKFLLTVNSLFTMSRSISTDFECSSDRSWRYFGKSFRYQGCSLISWIEMRFTGFGWSIRLIKSLTSAEMKSGMKYFPSLILLNRDGMLSSSNGKLPQTIAKRITPNDQTSTSLPP